MAWLFTNRLTWNGFRREGVLALLAIFLVACSSQNTTTATSTVTQPAVVTSTSNVVSTPSPVSAALPITSTPSTKSLFIASYIPDNIVQELQFSDTIQLTGDPDQSDYTLGLSDSPGASHWVYALVASFPTLTGDVSAVELLSAWSGTASGVLAGVPVLVDQPTYDLFAASWGNPGQTVKLMPANELLAYAWVHQPSVALIPFESIQPKWKVLSVDGQSPLHKDFNLDNYALSVQFGLLDKNGIPLLTHMPEGISLPTSNRDASKLSVVALTGVTALVRGTALWMERYGITYPGQDVGKLLRQADIAHISNEIPFTPDCPFPSIPTPIPAGQQLPLISFCSSPDYIALLEEVGADVVEITGDHFADWGDEAMQFTLDLYASHNLPVYGGGLNSEQARQPMLFEHNGNKIAFLGCNIGWPVRQDQIPQSALATAYHPGAAQCDFSWLITEIPRLRADGYQVIFTFQHREYDRMRAETPLIYDFGLIASYGATIVSGSQAHQPHSAAFEYDAFIHYGLGNLFFDQYHFCADYACDYAFIDQHYFYNNQYLGVELTPIVFIDLARPRLMTEAEGAALLEKVFAASGWITTP